MSECRRDGERGCNWLSRNMFQKYGNMKAEFVVDRYETTFGQMCMKMYW